MSTPDSFIEEVTEEVRRDRLFRTFRKYGWIGILAVVAIVGGTAVNEWLKSREEARAQAFGDAVLEAFDQGGTAERRAALAGIAADGAQTQLVQMLLAADPADDRAATLAALDKLAADETLPPVYRDLAVLRRVLVAGADMPLADRRAALEGIAVAGRPYRAMAAEQLAYLLIEEQKNDDAIKALQDLSVAQDATAALKARAGQIVVMLGGKPPESPAAAGDTGGAMAPSDG